MKKTWHTPSKALAMAAAAAMAAALAGCTPHDNAAASSSARASPDASASSNAPTGTRERPAKLDTSFKRKTVGGKYIVEIAPPASGTSVGRIQSWTLTLQTATGEPVEGANIDVSGEMPEHGHGLPTDPQAKPTIHAGRYTLDGMKFNMGGWWELHLKIRGPQGADRITFNTVLPE